MYLVLLLTHKQNIEKVRQKDWLKKCGLPYLILYGDKSIEEDYLYIKDTNTLIVKCPDTYEYLTLKLACAYKFIVTAPEMLHINGVFKVDDDVVVNCDRLKNLIKSYIHQDYVGHVYRIFQDTHCNHHITKTKDRSLQTITFKLNACDICYGPMYFLSRRALLIIVSKFSYHNFNIYSTEMYEDYTFGNILRKCNIAPVCIPMYTDNLLEFENKTFSFIAFHDNDHTQDLKTIDKNTNLLN
jgi:hypothetical protein